MMLKFQFILLFFTVITLSSVSGQEISGKRKAPKEVTPIIFKGIEYSAPASKKGFDSTMGMVFATNLSSGEVIWHKQVYQITLDENLERDVQTVYITSIKKKGNYLIIKNEQGNLFKLDLKTREVQALP